MEKFRNPLLVASAFVMFVTIIIHVFLGGPEINAVVQSSNLVPEVKATVAVIWHMITALLIYMFVVPLCLIRHSNTALATGLVVLEAVFAALFLGIGLYSFSDAFVLPQWTVFALSAVLAVPAMGRARS